ncbi:MAG: gamma-glutamyl-phosphate reductase, partial [Thermodesulfobacteriota bacterium]
MMESKDIRASVIEMAKKARVASRPLAAVPSPVKDRVLLRTAEALLARREAIAAENELDLAAGRGKGLSPAMLDRLALSEKVINSMVQGLREVAALP